jgi:mycothiol synthase
MKSNLFAIQHPVPEDLERVFNFLIAYDIAEFGEPDSDMDDLSDQWDEVDLSQDAWISLDPAGNLNGYAIVTDESNSQRFLDLFTISSLSPDGLAEVLYDLALERFQNLVKQGKSASDCILTTFANGFNPKIRAVIESRGFQVEKYHYRMQIDFQEDFFAPVWPPEYTLAHYKPQDEKELYDLIADAFDWPGFQMKPLEDWRKDIFRNGRFDPELFVMVRQSGRLIGAAICYNEETRGWIKELAISKELQGKGLGSLLLKHVFSVFSKKGLPTVALGVASTNKKASEFYERSGMVRTREFVQYYRKA